MLKSLKHGHQDDTLLKHLWGHTVPVTAESQESQIHPLSKLLPLYTPLLGYRGAGDRAGMAQGLGGHRPKALCTRSPEC